MPGFDPITAAINLGNTIVDRILPDKAANDQAKAQLTQMVVQGQLQEITGQLTIDATEAASKSIWVAGWRPYVGWICGTSLGYEFLLRPLLTFVVSLFPGMHGFQAPVIDTGQLLELLGGLLGMGAMRTVEKLNGVGNGH